MLIFARLIIGEAGVRVAKHISPSTAVQKALKEAHNVPTKPHPYNCGTDDFIYNTELEQLKGAWHGTRLTLGGATYVARDVIVSSGEPKADLRLAKQNAGSDAAVFNYHVRFKQNTAADAAAKAQSRADKANARQFQQAQAAKQAVARQDAKEAQAANRAEEKVPARRKQAMREAFNKLPANTRPKTPEDKRRWEAGWLEANKNRRF
ncbi:MAG TPA: hypothetical protein VE442_22470 [Jatrophihabitans sp.]|jgi:flagellar biosynthesis GTPase FlhF|nr:hypothetical protein [Jatrophihabitans sp.]